MAARSIASLSISFGLVSIPVKLYSATETSTAVHFKLMSSGGARLRQQYVADSPLPEPDEPPPRRELLPAPTAVPEPKRARSASAKAVKALLARAHCSNGLTRR